MNILRVVDKETLVFIRDDFAYDETKELGLDTAPSSGLYKSKAVKTVKVENGKEVITWSWVESGVVPIHTETISELKAKLASSDYKVIKCAEAQLANEPHPYDAISLHRERKELRERIAELEAKK